jgi:putative nucleotidyltransferase with HDIG domain
MTEITHQEAQRAAMLLTASIKSVTLYPQAHPAVRQPLKDLSDIFDGLLAEKSEIHLGVVEGVLFLDTQLFVTPNSSVAELAERLIGKGIYALTIYPGISQDDLFFLATFLARRDVDADLLFEELERNSIKTIRMGIDQIVYGDSTDHEGSAPSRMYYEALNAVRETMLDVERGRIPTGDRINAVVDDMVSMAIKDPTTLLGLSMIKDYDNYTFNHSVNVGILSLSLVAHLGMDHEVLRDTNTAGLLHDIGKVRIDRKILNKPGKLSAEEYEEMKKHAEKGAEIIAEMKGIHSQVADAVLGHHMKYNRSGYPEWARGRAFSPLADIVAVTDCYDAITTVRSYSLPIMPKAALEIMGKLAGSSLNGEFVVKFEDMMGKYPVGTLVRLDTNEIALIVRPNPMESSRPSVKVIIDRQGNMLEKPRMVDISGKDGSPSAAIVATVDPVLKNVDVGRYFLT